MIPHHMRPSPSSWIPYVHHLTVPQTLPYLMFTVLYPRRTEPISLDITSESLPYISTFLLSLTRTLPYFFTSQNYLLLPYNFTPEILFVPLSLLTSLLEDYSENLKPLSLPLFARQQIPTLLRKPLPSSLSPTLSFEFSCQQITVSFLWVILLLRHLPFSYFTTIPFLMEPSYASSPSKHVNKTTALVTSIPT